MYCAPILNRSVSDIDTSDVLAILKPIWLEKAETARRVRMRIERVLDYAKIHNKRTGENPARMRANLEMVLPKQSKKKKHFAAMAYEDIPEFWRRLRLAEGQGARSLEITVLTASRTSEVRLSRWGEFDLEKSVWTVPAGRMKGEEEHVVPLSAKVMNLLSAIPKGAPDDYVFPGSKPGRPLSNMSMSAVLKRLDIGDATVHGFRSGFRDWAGDETMYAREIAEMSLAHKVGDDTENAYRRRTAVDQRRALMNLWAQFVTGDDDDVIVLDIEKRRAKSA